MSSKASLKKQKVMAKEIMARYDNNIGVLREKGTAGELKAVMTYIANESNYKQRVTAGLEKE